MGFLTDLVGTIRRELDERPLPLEALDAAARSRPPARSLRDPLLETHSDRDLERALATDAEILGVNARDLQTLEVDIPAALGRLRSIPSGRLAVLESGIASHDDVTAAVAAGATAILVGEALMRAADPAAAIAGLVREPGVAARRQNRNEEEIA